MSKFASLSFSGKFVKYYETFFADKNFDAMGKFFVSLLQEECRGRKILDFGCGTGIFCENFAKNGYDVVGVDCSEDMIAYAKENHSGGKNITYFCEDIRNFKIPLVFDGVCALSHVVCYQASNDDLLQVFLNAYSHLQEGGIFVFDFYHQAGIFTHNLEARIKRVQHNEITITRFSEAKFDLMENCIDCSYKYLIEDRDNKPLFLESNDKMRFFSLKELEYCLKSIGFKVVDFFDLDDFKKVKLTSSNRNGYCLARK